MQTGETADLDCGANADLDSSRNKRRLMNFLNTIALVIGKKNVFGTIWGGIIQTVA